MQTYSHNGIAPHDPDDQNWQPWSNDGESVEFFDASGAFLGRAEERDGFVEVYDSNWNLLGRLLDGNGKTVSEIEALFPGFQTAWDAVSQYLPSDFQPAENAPLSFSVGDYDNILIYSSAGTMIGRVDIWTHERSNIRFHDGVEYTEEDETISFNFNDADWNNIARYESETDTITKMNGEDLDTPFIEETGEYISYSLFKDENSDNAWLTFKDLYDLPATLTDEQKTQLGFDWDDVDQINIGTRTETHPVTQIRDEEKVENSTRVEYFRKVVLMKITQNTISTSSL